VAVQGLVGLAAVGLVAYDQWDNRAVLLAPVKGQTVTSGSYGDELKTLGLEVLGVIVITVIAGVNDTWGATMGLLVLILWILALINKGAKK
jgi:hypothetical protein